MIKYLSQYKNKNWKKEICLVRTGFDVKDFKDDGFRLRAALPTLQFLLKKGAKIVILSHQGRPSGFEKEYSLKAFIPFLIKELDRKIIFLSDFDFEKIKKKILTEKAPAIFLLENLRFLEGEASGDEFLAKNLADLGTLYINDAFSVCHRNNTSITILPRLLPHYAGFLLEQEISMLTKVMVRPDRPLVLILGGAKISDKIDVVETFSESADHILVGGGIANTFFAAQDMAIGESLYEPKMVDWAKRFLLTKTARRVVFPVDWAKEKNKILDIGPLTSEIFANYVNKAKMIVWNGPLGKIEDERYQRGSVALAKAIAKSRSLSVAGGGETTQLISRLELDDKFSFVSSGGGAMLDFLSGKELPGIAVLKN